jgi:uncharacterized protein (DUF362 family)
MKSDWNRRKLIKTCALAGLGWETGLFGLDAGAAASGPALSIVKSKISPTDPAAIAEEARQLTRKAIEALGGMGRFIARGDVVWVKPNIGWDRRPEQAATTNPDVVGALVEMCFQAGAKKVFVSDHTCHSAVKTFARSGIQQAAEKAGAQSYYLDARKFRKVALKGKVLGEWELYGEVLEANKLINVPIVKQHSLCKATLGMKNLMGIAGGARERFHQDLRGTLADLAGFVRPTLVVLDAVRILTANGPTGGSLADVKRTDTVVASIDQVAADAFGATLLGYRPEEIGYIVEAGARGLGKLDFNALQPRRIEI